MYREPNQPPPSSAFSDRLRIRTGLLARSHRDDPAREPEELFDAIESRSATPNYESGGIPAKAGTP